MNPDFLDPQSELCQESPSNTIIKSRPQLSLTRGSRGKGLSLGPKVTAEKKLKIGRKARGATSQWPWALGHRDIRSQRGHGWVLLMVKGKTWQGNWNQRSQHITTWSCHINLREIRFISWFLFNEMLSLLTWPLLSSSPFSSQYFNYLH